MLIKLEKNYSNILLNNDGYIYQQKLRNVCIGGNISNGAAGSLYWPDKRDLCNVMLIVEVFNTIYQ